MHKQESVCEPRKVLWCLLSNWDNGSCVDTAQNYWVSCNNTFILFFWTPCLLQVSRKNYYIIALVPAPQSNRFTHIWREQGNQKMGEKKKKEEEIAREEQGEEARRIVTHCKHRIYSSWNQWLSNGILLYRFEKRWVCHLKTLLNHIIPNMICYMICFGSLPPTPK